EREAAFSHHDAGDAVPARRSAEGIPEDLRVHVRVAVHEAGRDYLTLGVAHLAGALADPADRDDTSVPDTDVGPIPRKPGSIDDRPVPDHQVVGHARILSLRSGARARAIAGRGRGR